MNALPKNLSLEDHAVAGLTLAACGRQDLNIAKSEMPAPMAMRTEHGNARKGACIAGGLHMMIQTGVLTETPQPLGAEVRAASRHPE